MRFYFMLEMYWFRIGDGLLEGPFGSLDDAEAATRLQKLLE